MGVFNNHWPPIIEILRNTLAFTYSLTYLLAVLLYACGLRLVDVTRLTETGGNSSVAPFIADSNQRSSLAPIHWYSHSFIHHFLSLSTLRRAVCMLACWDWETAVRRVEDLTNVDPPSVHSSYDIRSGYSRYNQPASLIISVREVT